MKDKELNQARRNYEKELQLNRTSLTRKEEAKRLLHDPNVRKFLSLQKYLNYQEPTDIDMIEKAFNLVSIYSENSNQILVYAGSYDNSGNFFINSDNIGEKVFWDLETMKVFNISIDEFSDFEMNHFIIYMPKFVRTVQDFNCNYFKLRRYFFSELMNKTQNEVVNTLKKTKNIEKILERKNL